MKGVYAGRYRIGDHFSLYKSFPLTEVRGEYMGRTPPDPDAILAALTKDRPVMVRLYSNNGILMARGRAFVDCSFSTHTISGHFRSTGRWEVAA